MQDFNYVWHGCMEVTLEISCCKYPPAHELPKYWEDNRVVSTHKYGNISKKSSCRIPQSALKTFITVTITHLRSKFFITFFY